MVVSNYEWNGSFPTNLMSLRRLLVVHLHPLSFSQDWRKKNLPEYSLPTPLATLVHFLTPTLSFVSFLLHGFCLAEQVGPSFD